MMKRCVHQFSALLIHHLKRTHANKNPQRPQKKKTLSDTTMTQDCWLSGTWLTETGMTTESGARKRGSGRRSGGRGGTSCVNDMLRKRKIHTLSYFINKEEESLKKGQQMHKYRNTIWCDEVELLVPPWS